MYIGGEDIVKIIRVKPGNPDEINLDFFDRQQEVNRVYVKKDEAYVLKKQPGIMNWTLEKKREVAHDLADNRFISYLAISDNRIIGFASLVKELQSNRMLLDVIQVDRQFRGKGIGRMLWETAYKEAKLYGAKEIYISACPSEETIGFYKAMGAVITDNPIRSIVEEEPDDLQLVCAIE